MTGLVKEPRLARGQASRSGWKPQRQKRDDTHEDCRSELVGNYIPCQPGVHLGKILRIAATYWAGIATVM